MVCLIKWRLNMRIVKKNILDSLEENGLEISSKTGGSLNQLPSFRVNKHFSSDLIYDLELETGESISFVEPNLFFKTFQETEKDLELTLFG